MEGACISFRHIGTDTGQDVPVYGGLGTGNISLVVELGQGDLFVGGRGCQE